MNSGTKEILRIAGLGSKVDMIELGLCPMCSNEIFIELMNDLQKGVYEETGLCVTCQNKV